jgi:hypothetical protein
MAFQITSHGSRGGVLKHIKEAKALPENSNQAQIEAVKLLLVAEINAIGPEFNGCRVDASGDAQPTMRTMSMNVVPMKLQLLD